MHATAHAQAHDLGRACGTVAHLTALRRESVGEFKVEGEMGPGTRIFASLCACLVQ